MNNNGYVTWKGLVPVLIGLFIGLSGIGAFALNQHGEVVKTNVHDLQKGLDHMISLKNIDNQWYRELGEDVSAMKADLGHVKEDIKEIKELMKH